MMIKGNIFCSDHVVVEFMIPFKSVKSKKAGSQLWASEDQTLVYSEICLEESNG